MQAPPVGSLKSNYFKIAVSHSLHADVSADTFLHRGEERGISVDRSTARCCQINHSWRDGSRLSLSVVTKFRLSFLMGERSNC
ncbi:hypothetical protein SAMN03159288_04651 [Rhizobium sp. NFACC06-2]|nr:hypothetical protein SAMN03159288_04651 [Rhizobium sp. NFACC06-2]